MIDCGQKCERQRLDDNGEGQGDIEAKRLDTGQAMIL